MIAGVRQRLSQLPKTTKTVILRITMILLIGFSLLAITAATWDSSPISPSPYSIYLQDYISKYGPEQDLFNRFIFYLTQEDVIFSNKQLKTNYYEEINSFVNMTEGEFQELYNVVTSIAKAKGYLEIAEFQDNYYYDWSDFLPPIKNMRDADASHIFAVTAALEFEVNKRVALQYRVEQNMTITTAPEDMITLSQQEVIDCCPTCLQHSSPKYVYYHLKNYGISPDKNYPYLSCIYNPGPFQCKTANSKKHYHLHDYYQMTSCRELAQQLESGPVVVAVDARLWRQYEGGIFEECSPTVKRNHFALVVGRGIGYWKIRNSWGPRWGEHGYIRIKSGNSCGVCGRASFPELE